MNTPQIGILQPPPNQARYLTFRLVNPALLRASLTALRAHVDGDATVAGFGTSLTEALGITLPGLKPFPLLTAPGLAVEATPDAIWLWLRGDDRGELLHRSRRLAQVLAPAFELHDIRDAFKYRDGRDLTGYEDGTENPTDDDATEAAFVGQEGPAPEGSSFVATQRWIHDFSRFEAMPGAMQDHAIGRRQSDNEELDDAPPSAHVKRTAQESFEPEAFVLRRSMPWAERMESGLMFVAFGKSFDAFEAQLKRMTGSEDGIVDALFQFTHPVCGAYYWCPPLKDGVLDLTALGL